MMAVDKGLASAVSYGIISTSITFFNKAVLSVFKFPYPVTLTLAQVVFAIVCSYIMKRQGLISYADFDKQHIKKVQYLCYWTYSLDGISGDIICRASRYRACGYGNSECSDVWVLLL